MAKALNLKPNIVLFVLQKTDFKGISYKERMVNALGNRGDEGRTRLR